LYSDIIVNFLGWHSPGAERRLAGAFCVQNPIANAQSGGYLSIPTDMYTFSELLITTFNPLAANANWHDVTQSTDVAFNVDSAAAKGKKWVLLRNDSPRGRPR
jgi:hypothetical protein